MKGNDSTKKFPGTAEDCGVLEEQFPHLGKCCQKLDGLIGAHYEKICPRCTVWISPPDPSSLEVAAIFECGRFGYCKRMKDI